MSIMQQNLFVEGSIGTNKTIEAINTSLYADYGTADIIQIDMKGYKNRLPNQYVIDNYAELTHVPIKIQKNVDTGENDTLYLNINGLGNIQCAANTTDGLEFVMPKNILKAGDCFTAMYDGTYFILDGGNIPFVINKPKTNLNNIEFVGQSDDYYILLTTDLQAPVADSAGYVNLRANVNEAETIDCSIQFKIDGTNVSDVSVYSTQMALNYGTKIFIDASGFVNLQLFRSAKSKMVIGQCSFRVYDQNQVGADVNITGVDIVGLDSPIAGTLVEEWRQETAVQKSWAVNVPAGIGLQEYLDSLGGYLDGANIEFTLNENQPGVVSILQLRSAGSVTAQFRLLGSFTIDGLHIMDCAKIIFLLNYDQPDIEIANSACEITGLANTILMAGNCMVNANSLNIAASVTVSGKDAILNVFGASGSIRKIDAANGTVIIDKAYNGTILYLNDLGGIIYDNRTAHSLDTFVRKLPGALIEWTPQALTVNGSVIFTNLENCYYQRFGNVALIYGRFTIIGGNPNSYNSIALGGLPMHEHINHLNYFDVFNIEHLGDLRVGRLATAVDYKWIQDNASYLYVLKARFGQILGGYIGYFLDPTHVQANDFDSSGLRISIKGSIQLLD